MVVTETIVAFFDQQVVGVLGTVSASGPELPEIHTGEALVAVDRVIIELTSERVGPVSCTVGDG